MDQEFSTRNRILTDISSHNLNTSSVLGRQQRTAIRPWKIVAEFYSIPPILHARPRPSLMNSRKIRSVAAMTASESRK